MKASVCQWCSAQLPGNVFGSGPSLGHPAFLRRLVWVYIWATIRYGELSEHKMAFCQLPKRYLFCRKKTCCEPVGTQLDTSS